MGINVYEITALHNNLLQTTSTVAKAGASASEFPVVADNLNGQLTRYTRLAGVWDSANIGNNPGVVTSGSWGQANGRGSDSTPFRSIGSYFIRGVYFSDVADGTNNYRSGYIGSFVGGLLETQYGHDPNGASVDYETIYGHGVTTFPQGATFSTQFRDPSRLPADNTAVVSNHNSAYSKTRYMPPSTFLVVVSSTTTTLGSGNVRVWVEERPSLQVATLGSHSPLDSAGVHRTPNSDQTLGNNGALKQTAFPATSYNGGNQYSPLGTQATSPVNYPYELFYQTGVRKLNNRAASLLLARIFDNTSIAYGSRYEEDGSDATVQPVNTQTEYIWQRSATQAGATTAAQDQRVRQTSYFTINDEYYGFVMDTKCLIYSNKASMVPLIFFDLTDTWGANKRIAGVAVSTTAADPWAGHIYFLSEDGKLADYDFTGSFTNGVISAKTAATAPAANEAYSSLALSSDGLKLYALYGTMAADSRTTSTGVGTPRVAVRPYTILSDTWGALDVSPLQGRINVRSLREMQVLRDGRMAILCEHTFVTGGNTENFAQSLGSTNNCAWQLMIYDPSATAKWNTSIINGGTPNRSNQFSNATLTSNVVTIAAVNTFSAGDQVTINGLIGTSYAFLEGTKATVLTAGLSGTQFSFNFTHGNVGSVGLSAGRATSGWQYGSDVTGNPGNSAAYTWFQNINAFVHDVKANTLLIQGNWTASELYSVTLNAAGGAGPSAPSANVAVGFNTYTSGAGTTSSSIVHSDFIVAQPVEIRHNRDYITGGAGATTGDRTIFWFNTNSPSAIGSVNSGLVPLYYAPPSFVWNGATVMSRWADRNVTDNSGFAANWDQDKWTFGSLLNPSQQPNVHPQWSFPTQFTGNFLHFVKIDGMGNVEGVPTSSIYGQYVSQTLAYVPTYWKWNGSAWTLADNYADANTSGNGYPVPLTPATDVPLPWGLQIRFTAGTYGLAEFHTFNVCWGNTKFARKVRFPWAMFAGQTLLQTDTRTLATQNALQMIFNETDHSSVAFSGPTLRTDGGNSGWNSQTVFPKLDNSNNPNNAPVVMTITCANFDPATILNAPMASTTTLANGGVTTQITSSNGDQASAPSWFAFAGGPSRFWRSSLSPASNPYIQMDFGSGKTVVAYSFRPYWDSDTTHGNAPTTWTLKGSNTGVFGGEETTIDTRAGVTVQKGMAFTCNGATGSFRYYRMRITATTSSAVPMLGMLQFYSNSTQGAINFVDLSFLPHGSNQAGGNGYDSNFASDGSLNINSNYARGLKFEVSTNGGGAYSTITPLWRAHNGHVFSFARQVGVTNIRITCTSPYNHGTGVTGDTNDTLNAAFGPVYTYDYGVNQAALNNARLGSSGSASQTPTNPAAGSFEPNNLGVAVDAMTVSIDGGSPNALSTVYTQNAFNGTNYIYSFTSTQIERFAILSFWDGFTVPANCYKVHPYFGFIFFEGAGANNVASLKAGTSASITYHWGRRT
jgi:hypothetical protein